VASNGGLFLMAWFQKGLGNSVQGVFVNSEFGAPFPISNLATIRLDAQVQPQVASDGTRWVVVWDDGSGIAGAALRPGWIVEPLAISPTGMRPAIAAAGPDHFLVTYEIYGPGRHLAARRIDFVPPAARRDRAVR